MYTTVYATPRSGRLSVLDISTVGTVSVPKRPSLGSRRRELSEDVPFGIVGTLLVVERCTPSNTVS